MSEYCGKCRLRRICWHGDVCLARSSNDDHDPLCFKATDKQKRLEVEKPEHAPEVQDAPANAAEYREGELF